MIEQVVNIENSQMSQSHPTLSLKMMTTFLLLSDPVKLGFLISRSSYETVLHEGHVYG